MVEVRPQGDRFAGSDSRVGQPVAIHMERSIARCRLLLSVIALIAVYVDPTGPTLMPWLDLGGGRFAIDPHVLSVMGGHLLYSALVYYVLVRGFITATVTDGGGKSATDSVTVSVNAAPTVEITAPANNAVYATGQDVTFTGSATDLEDLDLSGAIHWASSLNGQGERRAGRGDHRAGDFDRRTGHLGNLHGDGVRRLRRRRLRLRRLGLRSRRTAPLGGELHDRRADGRYAYDHGDRHRQPQPLVGRVGYDHRRVAPLRAS